MPINFGLLSDAALTGLSDEEKNSLQKQATTQFLLGSLLSNDPSMGLKSAYSVPDQYLSGQKAIAEMKEKTRQRGEVANFLEQYAPTPSQAGQRALAAGGRGPTVAAGQNQIDILNAPIDFNRALADSLRLSGNPAQPQIRETLSAMQPKAVGQVMTDVNGRPISVIPSADIKSGLTLGGNVTGGNVNFQGGQLPGFRQATALNTLPELDKGEEYLFDAMQNVVGIRNVSGAIQSLVDRTAASTAAREANIPRQSTDITGAPTFTFVKPPNLNQPSANQQGGVNQPVTQPAVTTTVGPSTAQTALNEAFRPILTDAYAGYKTASARSATLQQLRNAFNNPNFDTNAFTPAKTAIVGFLNASGVTGPNANQYLTSAASARQGLNTIAAQSVSELPGAISNFEINFAQGRFGVITDPKDSNKYAIDLMEVADNRKKQYYDFVSNAKNAGPDVIQKWQSSPQGSASLFEDPKLRKYLPQYKVNSGPDKGKTAYQMPNGGYRVYD
jgi:hypothetical protein